MPELPEVETLAALLRPLIVGKRVLQCQASVPRLRLPLPTRLPFEWHNWEILDIRRRGKYLLVPGPADQVLVIHLGMTGWLSVSDSFFPADRHERWRLLFGDGSSLRFADPRKFGQIFFSKFSTPDTIAGLPELGVEPLSSRFTGSLLYALSRRVRRPLKPWLLDQSVIVGIGNIYASESLFQARLSPTRHVASLTREECLRLCRAIRHVLRDSIAAGSTCAQAIPQPTENTTHYTLSLHVYEREGCNCSRCGAGIIHRLVQSGRSTYWCPECQSAAGRSARQRSRNES
ncbi:MAG TPA: bifunctional DNA-formamidopyrimidine glycosylase/DNA-(apurinic or apyrimidinic site) lyase [Candidatus Ozemobacteraceae bacterium]|nr:bifunctional DNA-formamidopyrimidine glycosylase/DNA-(apurinic or apyrimidinic site) lyase [Candidatus Ozemobacteraceae bacterium]